MRVGYMLDTMEEVYIQYAKEGEHDKLERARKKVLKSNSSRLYRKHIYTELLRWSAWYGHLDIVKYALSKGAYIYRDGSICAAAKRGHLDVVKYLFEHGADCEMAMASAAVYERIDVVRYLLSQGVDTSYTYTWIHKCRPRFIQTILEFSGFNKYFPPEIIQRICQYG